RVADPHISERDDADAVVSELLRQLDTVPDREERFGLDHRGTVDETPCSGSDAQRANGGIAERLSHARVYDDEPRAGLAREHRYRSRSRDEGGEHLCRHLAR